MTKKNKLAQWHSEKNNLSAIVLPKLTYRLVWDVKIQNFLLARFPCQIINNLNYIHCPRVMLESTFKLVLHWLWSLSDILYTFLFSQLEWPIIMTKQLLIICEWCSHRLIRSIQVWSWLENLKRAFSWLWSCLVVPLAVCSCRENLEFVAKAWIKPKFVCESLN